MKNLAMIACVSSDNGLGKNGKLLWNFKDDMRFFRDTTSHHTVVMGRKTFESISQPLPNRQNIVLSREDLSNDGVEVFHSEPELREFLAKSDTKVFIIGGATLYNMFINDAEEIFLTEVESQKPADTFFPSFDCRDFTRQALEYHEVEGVKFEIVKYTRVPRHG